MKIDITREPPADIFRKRGTYFKIAAVLLGLAGGGISLAVYAVFSATPSSQKLDDAALALFAGPALLFAYFAAKLQAYKRLSTGEERELAGLARKHPEVAAYCASVVKSGRQVIHAEYEACKDWDEDPGRQTPAAE